MGVVKLLGRGNWMVVYLVYFKAHRPCNTRYFFLFVCQIRTFIDSIKSLNKILTNAQKRMRWRGGWHSRVKVQKDPSVLGFLFYYFAFNVLLLLVQLIGMISLWFCVDKLINGRLSVSGWVLPKTLIGLMIGDIHTHTQSDIKSIGLT